MITKRDWHDWKQQEVTKELILAIKEKREYIKEGLAEERYDDSYQKWAGHTQALKDIILFITVDWKEELDD